VVLVVKKVLKFLQFKCLTLIPFCPVCIGHQIATYEFLSELELLISKVHYKGKRLIFCGDMNVNFFTIQHKTARLTKFIVDE